MTGYALVRTETIVGELSCPLRCVKGRGRDKRRRTEVRRAELQWTWTGSPFLLPGRIRNLREFNASALKRKDRKRPHRSAALACLPTCAGAGRLQQGSHREIPPGIPG